MSELSSVSVATSISTAIGMASEDTLALEASLRVVAIALDKLIRACVDERGLPMAPSKGDLMRARAMLPMYCEMQLSKKTQP